MCKILMPINPEYVDEILSGNKKYEYRKIKAKRKNIDKMVIYSTSPIMRVVAEVDVEGIIEDSPEKLWEKTKEYSGITKDFYSKYLHSEKDANKITMLKKVNHGLSVLLKEFPKTH